MLALLWNPLEMLLKVIYVLDIMLLYDGPLIQLFVAISSQIVGVVFVYYVFPYDSKKKNWQACFYSSMTVLLMISCVLYT